MPLYILCIEDLIKKVLNFKYIMCYTVYAIIYLVYWKTLVRRYLTSNI